MQEVCCVPKINRERVFGMEMIDLLPQGIVDSDAVRQRFGDALGLWEKYVFRFNAESPTYASLREAIRQGEVKRIEEEAHSLKGLAGMLGFSRVYEASAQLVADCRAQRHDSLAADWDALEEAYQALAKEIENLAERRRE